MGTEPGRHDRPRRGDDPGRVGRDLEHHAPGVAEPDRSRADFSDERAAREAELLGDRGAVSRLPLQVEQQLWGGRHGDGRAPVGIHLAQLQARSEPQHPELSVRHRAQRAGQGVVDDVAARRYLGDGVQAEQVRRGDVQPARGGGAPGQVGQPGPGHRPPVGQPGPVLRDQGAQHPAQLGLGGIPVAADRGPGDGLLQHHGGRLGRVILRYHVAGPADQVRIRPVPLPQLLPQPSQHGRSDGYAPRPPGGHDVRPPQVGLGAGVQPRQAAQPQGAEQLGFEPHGQRGQDG